MRLRFYVSLILTLTLAITNPNRNLLTQTYLSPDILRREHMGTTPRDPAELIVN